MGERLLTELRVVLDYLRWILLPDAGEMSLYHDDYQVSRGLFSPPTTAFALLTLSGLLLAAIALRNRRPLLGLGLILFFSGHLLTATVIPLELVFEHRNYFSTLGICVGAFDFLFLSPVFRQHRLVGITLGGFMLLFFAWSTLLRAKEWSNPVRFSQVEVAKHPQSARATYDWARTLIVLGEYDPKSPFTREAFGAIELARRVPASGVLPVQALLLLAARTGTPIEDDWWTQLNEKLANNPIGPQERSAIGALTKCAVEGHCKFVPQNMLELYAAALSRGPDPFVLNIYGDYALNVLGDAELALKVWQEAISLRPGDIQFRANRAKLFIALGKWEEAIADIRTIESIGKFGQSRDIASDLEARLQAAQKSVANPVYHPR